jgi:hypothetical protein
MLFQSNFLQTKPSLFISSIGMITRWISVGFSNFFNFIFSFTSGEKWHSSNDLWGKKFVDIILLKISYIKIEVKNCIKSNPN